MPSDATLFATVAVGAAITFSLRVVPFALLVPLRRSPLLGHLGPTLPPGVLTILAIYLLRGVDLDHAATGLTQTACLLLAATIFFTCRSASLAIVASTVAYMLAANLAPGIG